MYQGINQLEIEEAEARIVEQAANIAERYKQRRKEHAKALAEKLAAAADVVSDWLRTSLAPSPVQEALQVLVSKGKAARPGPYSSADKIHAAIAEAGGSLSEVELLNKFRKGPSEMREVARKLKAKGREIVYAQDIRAWVIPDGEEG